MHYYSVSFFLFIRINVPRKDNVDALYHAYREIWQKNRYLLLDSFLWELKHLEEEVTTESFGSISIIEEWENLNSEEVKQSTEGRHWRATTANNQHQDIQQIVETEVRNRTQNAKTKYARPSPSRLCRSPRGRFQRRRRGEIETKMVNRCASTKSASLEAAQYSPSAFSLRPFPPPLLEIFLASPLRNRGRSKQRRRGEHSRAFGGDSRWPDAASGDRRRGIRSKTNPGEELTGHGVYLPFQSSAHSLLPNYPLSSFFSAQKQPHLLLHRLLQKKVVAMASSEIWKETAMLVIDMQVREPEERRLLFSLLVVLGLDWRLDLDRSQVLSIRMPSGVIPWDSVPHSNFVAEGFHSPWEPDAGARWGGHCSFSDQSRLRRQGARRPRRLGELLLVLLLPFQFEKIGHIFSAQSQSSRISFTFILPGMHDSFLRMRIFSFEGKKKTMNTIISLLESVCFSYNGWL